MFVFLCIGVLLLLLGGFCYLFSFGWLWFVVGDCCLFVGTVYYYVITSCLVGLVFDFMLLVCWFVWLLVVSLGLVGLWMLDVYLFYGLGLGLVVFVAWGGLCFGVGLNVGLC